MDGFYNHKVIALKEDCSEPIKVLGLPSGVVTALAVHPHMTLDWNKIAFTLGTDNLVRAHRVEFVMG
jgi:hypothetical protein